LRIGCEIYFGSKKEEVTEELRRLLNEELRYMYCSSNVIRVIKSRRIGWAGHVARMEEKMFVYRPLVGKPEGKR